MPPLALVHRMHAIDCARDRCALRLASIGDVGDRLLDGGDLLGIFVGNFDFEFLFESHDELNGVERIGAQIIDERRIVHDLLGLHAKLLGYDRFDLLFNSAHWFIGPSE
jgi:hypothetical protein